MSKKYKLIESNIEGLYRIKALRDFSDVKKGDMGGYVSGEHNLSHEGNCWLYHRAQVIHKAAISGNVALYYDAKIQDDFKINDSKIEDDIKFFGHIDRMYKFVEETDEFYIYENNNKYSKDLYSRQEADQAIKTIINSRNLLNCIKCIDSSDSSFCKGCFWCTESKNLLNCTFCYRCEYSIGCKRCSYTNDAEYCTFCWFGNGIVNENKKNFRPDLCYINFN